MIVSLRQNQRTEIVRVPVVENGDVTVVTCNLLLTSRPPDGGIYLGAFSAYLAPSVSIEVFECGE